MQNKTIKKILDAQMSGKLQTDSDIEDFARDSHLRFDDICCVIASHTPELEKCRGCEYIIHRCYHVQPTTPCYLCSRRVQVTDNYVKSKKRYYKASKKD